LPLLPPAEVRRQIEINDETNRRYFGDAYQRKGIFLPEMAWSPELAPMLEDQGFEWVMLDELAYNGRVNEVDYTKTYRVAGTKLKAVFREHRLSATIMSAAPRDIERLKEAAREEAGPERYVVTAMDGETFGHHRISHEQLLFAMFADEEIRLTGTSDLLTKFTDVVEVPTVACTWASNAADIAEGTAFISWNDPSNELHRLQWELVHFTVKALGELANDDPSYPKLRAQLDIAMGSDPMFWAAAKPWWMIEHIERGAYQLLAILQELPGIAATQGLDLYQRIMAMAWDWQRTGKIDEMAGKREALVRIPFKEATHEQGDHATWRAFLDLLKREELAAAARGDYEEAILWRNATYKLEHKLDIYDSHYVIDLLRSKLPAGEVEATVAEYRQEFDRIRGGQVEQRSN
jgi:predicted glycosyl hydrolase (DUF1957 family)